VLKASAALAVSGTHTVSEALDGRVAAPSARRARPAPAPTAAGRAARVRAVPAPARAVPARGRRDGMVARAKRRRGEGGARVRTAHGNRDDLGPDRATLGDRAPPRRAMSAARVSWARSVPGGRGRPPRGRDGPPGRAGIGPRDETRRPAATLRGDESGADRGRTRGGGRAGAPDGRRVTGRRVTGRRVTGRAGTGPGARTRSATSRSATSRSAMRPGGTDPGGTDPGGTDPGGTRPGGTRPGATSRSAMSPGGTGRTGTGRGARNGVLRVRGSRASLRC
jgi:hypothetical protein